VQQHACRFMHAGSCIPMQPAAMVQEAPCRKWPVSSISLLGSRCGMDSLGIRGSMGTVPRQGSVPNGSMHHGELF
jgi:hypothetical protein